MKVFLASTSVREQSLDLKNVLFFLESFYSLKNKKTIERISGHNKENFFLDSGAFTFMNGKGIEKEKLKKYVDRYCDFINKYDIKYFFELDIDAIYGYEYVKKIRNYIEKKTKKRCIPVWHKSRGLEEWVKLTKKYNYVAIGGIVIKEITKKDYKYFSKLIDIAHKNKCKVHGLGFTSTKELYKYHFDSVDSTNWLSGGRFATLQKFNGKYIESKNFKNKKLKHYLLIDEHNLKEWIKFQKYAYNKL